MKIHIFLFLAGLFLAGSLSAQVPQETRDIRIPLLGETAPSFTGQTTTGTLNFPKDYFRKWKILFSHPGDFTPVCSTEILELAALQDDFNKLNAKLVVMSTDGIHSHIEWVKSLESIKYNGAGPFKINFPLVSDPTLDISRKYGMISPESVTTKDVRGVFIIDPQDKIQGIFFYSNMTGRNIDEIKRTLIALQTATENDLLTPANWQPGKPLLINSPASNKEAEKLAGKNDPDLYSLTWYLWFKRAP
jgi:peroxiredoxin (alkyl hydroperoxide reductase subunit C)